MFDWFDGFMLFLWGIIVFLVIALGGMIYLMIEEDQVCKSAGGHWVGTGEYYTTTTTVMVGKVAVPQTQTHEETVCTHIETGEVIELD